MALHKFSPGGCRQDCETSGCCPSGTCTDGRSYTEYTLKVYRNGVLQATYTLPHNAAESSGSTCAFVSLSADAGICGEASGWGLLTFGVASGQTTYSVALYSSDPLANNPQLQLTAPGVALGSAPQDCTQTLTGTFTIFSAACNGYTWTYQIEPSGTLCTAAATNSCCPCDACRLLRDDFNRTAGTDLGANWTETAGQWTLESPSRLATDDTSAIVLSTTSSSAVGIAVTAKGASGDKIRLIAGYQNASNYFYAEFTWGSGTISIYERSGGSDTLLQTGTEFGTLTANEYARIYFCSDGSGTFVARTTSGGGLNVGASGSTPTGSQYGLGTGTTNGGSVEFSRFESYVISAACEDCNRCCSQNDETDQYEVDLGAGGLTNVNCTNCAAVAGVFVLTRVGAPLQWQYENTNFCAQSCSATPGVAWTLRITLTRQTLGASARCRWHLAVLLQVLSNNVPQLPCGSHYSQYWDALEDASEPCAGSWSLPRMLTTETATKPCTGNLPATIGLASV